MQDKYPHRVEIIILDELPRWAYSDDEWKQIEEETEYIKNDTRYKMVTVNPEPDELKMNELIM